MKTSLFALLAAVGIALTAPINQAHAGTCSQSLLNSYEAGWVPTQFSPALVAQGFEDGSYCGYGPVGGCGYPLNQTCIKCSQSGVTGWWDWAQTETCGGTTAIPKVWGKVIYRPNPTYTFHYECKCVEGTYSCYWQ